MNLEKCRPANWGAFELLPRLAYPLHIDKESRSRLQAIRHQLAAQPDLSALLYFNHISYGDPYFAASVAHKIDPSRTRRWAAPASYSHTDPENPRSKSMLQLVEAAKSLGIEVFRIIQAYQIDNPEFGYSREQAKDTYNKMMYRLQDIRKRNPILLMLSPEGHRSDSGELGEVEKGVVGIAKWIAPTLMVPVGLIFEKDFKRDSVNIGTPVEVRVGETLQIYTKRDDVSLEIIMANLAYALPEVMRGKWG